MNKKNKILYKVGKFNNNNIAIFFVIITAILTGLSALGLKFDLVTLLYTGALLFLKKCNDIYEKIDIEEKENAKEY